MKQKAAINTGGINGLGEGLVNPNSSDFKDLQSIIQSFAERQSEEERLQNELLSIRFQMESYLAEAPMEITRTGQFIERFLKAISVKKKDFARYVNYEESNLSALLKGRRKVNIDLAMKLGQIFHLDPLIWLQIETKNDLLQSVRANEAAYTKYSLKDLLNKAG
jgi:plasmid maintenance system antidote protein VapI